MKASEARAKTRAVIVNENSEMMKVVRESIEKAIRAQAYSVTIPKHINPEIVELLQSEEYVVEPGSDQREGNNWTTISWV